MVGNAGSNKKRKYSRTADHTHHERLAPYATERAWQRWSKTHPNILTNEVWADQEHNLKLTFPDYIKDVDHLFAQIQFQVNNDDERDTKGISHFRAWLKKWSPSNFEAPGSDPLQFRNWLLPLWLSWKTATYGNRDENGNLFGNADRCVRANIRRGPVDDLLRWAFQFREGAGHVFRMHAPVAGAPSYELTAGAVTTVDLPKVFAQHINCVFRNYILSWSWWRDNSPYVEENVITFVFEVVQARGDEGNDEGEKELKITERRLVTELYTAQRQRRALHMKDGFVFGALLDVRLMHMYVSYWRDGTLVVDRVFRRFWLTEFGDVVECFFLFCKIADFQREWLEDEFARWHEDIFGRKQIILDAAESEPSWRDGPYEVSDASDSGRRKKVKA